MKIIFFGSKSNGFPTIQKAESVSVFVLLFYEVKIKIVQWIKGKMFNENAMSTYEAVMMDRVWIAFDSDAINVQSKKNRCLLTKLKWKTSTVLLSTIEFYVSVVDFLNINMQLLWSCQYLVLKKRREQCCPFRIKARKKFKMNLHKWSARNMEFRLKFKFKRNKLQFEMAGSKVSAQS